MRSGIQIKKHGQRGNKVLGPVETEEENNPKTTMHFDMRLK